MPLVLHQAFLLIVVGFIREVVALLLVEIGALLVWFWVSEHDGGLRRLRGYVQSEHSLVVDQDPFGEPFENPGVLQSLERRDSLCRVPIQTLANKVEESLALVSDYFNQGTAVRKPISSAWLFKHIQRFISARLKEFVFALGVFEHAEGWLAEGLHD
mmetsp:Transcript_8727/g.10782  ORF Transcript_8727/g.10782 Transcript_8727/m.10782 type:complete len:157 (-) Transcript_8727:808-1278(-)